MIFIKLKLLRSTHRVVREIHPVDWCVLAGAPVFIVLVFLCVVHIRRTDLIHIYTYAYVLYNIFELEV